MYINNTHINLIIYYIFLYNIILEVIYNARAVRVGCELDSIIFTVKYYII